MGSASDLDEPSGAMARRPSTGIATIARGPGLRAALGATLIVLSALAMLMVWQRATRPRGEPFVVVTRDMAPGMQIQSSDLATARVDAPPELTAGLATKPDAVVGSYIRQPIAKYELLAKGSTSDTATSERRRISLELSDAQALGGELPVGSTVDVISVPGPDQRAAVVARDAVIWELNRGSESMAMPGIVVILSLANEDEVLAVIDASGNGGVILSGREVLPEGSDPRGG